MGENDRRRKPTHTQGKMNERIIRLRKKVKDWYMAETVH